MPYIRDRAPGAQIEEMVEIHYHLLFGLDDGPETIEASLALAEASIAEGVTHIVCTPHASDHYSFRPASNRARLAALKERLGDRITLGLGCDFHLSYDNIEDLKKDPTKYTINGKQYLLVEFPNSEIPASISGVLFQMIASGIVPILTHPERNPTLVEDPSRLIEWLLGGCLVQLTAGSLCGRFGRRAESMSHMLLERNWVHFIASDAHSVENRPPMMASAHEILVKRYGQPTADRLCLNNPLAAFLGDPMPDQPKPLGLSESSKSNRGSFLKRFFRNS